MPSATALVISASDPILNPPVKWESWLVPAVGCLSFCGCWIPITVRKTMSTTTTTSTKPVAIETRGCNEKRLRTHIEIPPVRDARATTNGCSQTARFLIKGTFDAFYKRLEEKREKGNSSLGFVDLHCAPPAVRQHVVNCFLPVVQPRLASSSGVHDTNHPPA